jgi:uncharacterized protein (TIGR03000 family)
MYGVVLMMALSGGADVPAMNETYVEPAAKYGDHGHKEYRLFGGRRGGCCGGGGYYGGCYGGGYGGCYGGGYSGGCTGGWGGYAGGCTGGWGGYSGGCTGGWAYGGGGGYSGAMPYAGGYYSSAMPYTGGYGDSWSGSPVYSGNLPIEGGYQYGLPSDAGQRGYYDGNSSAPATIVVRLPADATLTVDDSSTRSTGDVRTFISPPLEPGREYTYTLRAVETRDGKKLERKRDVKVRAGQTSEVKIDFAEQIPAPGQ